MDSAEDRFFEQLARSGKRSKEEPESEPQAPEAEFARASNSTPVASRLARREREKEELLGPEGQLTIDVYQTPDDIVVQSAIAGVRPEDIDIDVTNDSVAIRGSRHREQEVEDTDYFYQECYWGRFSRSVILPQEIDPENASVTFKNGILTVRLPKVVRRKTKKLQIRYE